MVLFTSEECHYSIHKFAGFIGIGEDNVINIKTNDIGQMLRNDLEKKIQEQIKLGNAPFAVVATLGT